MISLRADDAPLSHRPRYFPPGRIEPSDSIAEIMQKLSEGNIGALTVLIALVKREAAIDPDSMTAPFGTMFSLDFCEIYGSRIWVLYKDVCGENLIHFVGLLRATQLGLVCSSDVFDASDSQNVSLDLAAILAQVRAELSGFAKDEPQVSP